MKIKPTPKMIAIAERIAAKCGVSVNAVLSKVDRSVEKTSFRWNDVFWGDSVITLCSKKSARRSAAARSSKGCGAVSP